MWIRNLGSGTQGVVSASSRNLLESWPYSARIFISARSPQCFIHTFNSRRTVLGRNLGQGKCYWSQDTSHWIFPLWQPKQLAFITTACSVSGYLLWIPVFQVRRKSIERGINGKWLASTHTTRIQRYGSPPRSLDSQAQRLSPGSKCSHVPALPPTMMALFPCSIGWSLGSPHHEPNVWDWEGQQPRFLLTSYYISDTQQGSQLYLVKCCAELPPV